jgi:outer membrane protein
MNAESKITVVTSRQTRLHGLMLATLCAGWCLFAGTAQAAGLMDKLSQRWDDPLLTRPPVLALGSVLPGDSSPAPCPAWEDGTALTLAQAVNLALCLNPQVQSAWAGIKQQAAALGEAKAAYWPTASLSASRTNDHTGYPDSELASTSMRSNTLYGNLSWKLWDFGGREANRRAAAALLDAALATHDATLQKTLASVIGAYFDAQTAKATEEAKKKSQSLAQQTLETAQRREGRGAGSQTDTLQAATAVAKASLELSRAQGDLRKATSVLVYALGIPSASHITLADDVADTTDTLRESLDAWLEQAQTQHPAILAARAQLEAAQQKLRATEAEGLPSVDLGGSFYQNGRPNQTLSPAKTRETMASLTVTIPLFEGFARTYKVRGAQAQVELQQAQLRDVQQQTLMEVVKVHADAMSALQNLQASQNLLDAAQQALASVQRKFDRGATDILEILNTQSALADAQLERIRTLAEWRSARLRLLASVGGLGRSALGQ